MRQVKYKVDLESLKVAPTEIAKMEESGQKALFENLLYQVAGVKFPQGMDRSKRKSVKRILAALDGATSDSLCVEEAEYDLLKSLFCEEGLLLPANQVRILDAYAENIEAALKEDSGCNGKIKEMPGFDRILERHNADAA